MTAALDSAAKAREQGDHQVQQRAEIWLQQQGTEILPALATVLHDPQADIARRITACRVLAALGKAARGELLKALASKDRLVKLAATERISLIQPADKATVQALIQLLEDPDPPCRRIAIQSLRRIGTQARSAIPPLAAIANESEDESIRGEAVKALKEIDPRHTLSRLRE
ncbi:MAG: HEAT repeat domain-containing protein [Pirellulaceae bacterium]